MKTLNINTCDICDICDMRYWWLNSEQMIGFWTVWSSGLWISRDMDSDRPWILHTPTFFELLIDSIEFLFLVGIADLVHHLQVFADELTLVELCTQSEVHALLQNPFGCCSRMVLDMPIEHYNVSLHLGLQQIRRVLIFHRKLSIHLIKSRELLVVREVSFNNPVTVPERRGIWCPWHGKRRTPSRVWSASLLHHRGTTHSNLQVKVFTRYRSQNPGLEACSEVQCSGWGW